MPAWFDSLIEKLDHKGVSSGTASSFLVSRVLVGISVCVITLYVVKIVSVGDKTIIKHTGKQQVDVETIAKNKSKNDNDGIDPFLNQDEEKIPESNNVLSSQDLRFDNRMNYLHFPPIGKDVGSVPAKIFYPLQKRYVDVEIKLTAAQSGFFLYGAALCEEDINGQVILNPCIFTYYFSFADKETKKRPVEADLLKAINTSKVLEFYPWARYATSTEGCTSGSGKFRISVQFRANKSDTLISLSVPSTSDTKNAQFDLADKSTQPCDGIELFFTRENLLILLSKLEKEKKVFASTERQVTGAHKQ